MADGRPPIDHRVDAHGRQTVMAISATVPRLTTLTATLSRVVAPTRPVHKSPSLIVARPGAESTLSRLTTLTGVMVGVGQDGRARAEVATV